MLYLYEGQARKGKGFSLVSLPLNENTPCEKDNMKLKIAVITI